MTIDNLIIFVSPRTPFQDNPIIKLVIEYHTFVKDRIDWLNENLDPTKWVVLWGNFENYTYNGNFYDKVFYIGVAFFDLEDMLMFKIACG